MAIDFRFHRIGAKAQIASAMICVLILTGCMPVASSMAGGPSTKPSAPHNYARWEGEISALEAARRANPPPKGAMLFTGSSTIRLWKTLAEDLPGQSVINQGFGGSQIVDATHFADRIIYPYEPKYVFIRAGGNDLWNGKSAEQVFADYRQFVETIHAKLPQARIVFISLSPSVARWSQADKERAVNTMVQDYVKQQQARGATHAHYIETYDLTLGPDKKPRAELFVVDMLHFNAEGYKLFSARLREALPKITAQP